jgi:hypothetical protein
MSERGDKIWKQECALRVEAAELIKRVVATLPREDAIAFLNDMAEDATSAMVELNFHCVDCDKDTDKSGEYYMVRDEVWAASKIEPHGGMLCLRCLERRIGREIDGADFTAQCPSRKAWNKHVAARAKAKDAAAPA